jgi:hypothetical protein
LLLEGWGKASPAVSETGGHVREYRITPAGRRQLDAERARHQQVIRAIAAVIDTP